MTTLEEISADRQANREFWTEQARFSLLMMREREDEPCAAARYRTGFRKNMASRRNLEYFEGER